MVVFARTLAALGAVTVGAALGPGGRAPGCRLPPAANATSASGVPYRAPAPGAVIRGFQPPATRYGPGHLGVDLRAAAGQPVHAAGAGVVRFAGPVAGRGVVVLVHSDGVSTEYEPVRPSVRAGARIRAGQPIGTVQGRHRGCPSSCLHWGARRGTAYLDPLLLLQPLGPVVLLPWPRDG